MPEFQDQKQDITSSQASGNSNEIKDMAQENSQTMMYPAYGMDDDDIAFYKAYYASNGFNSHYPLI